MQECTGWQEVISPGSVVVMAARLGDEVVWHPQCLGTHILAHYQNPDETEAKQVATSLIDMEGEVDFCKHPVKSNWSPFVLDSSKNRYVLIVADLINAPL